MPETKTSHQAIRTQLKQCVDAEKAAFFPRFFKTGPGEYGEGDEFLGVTVPHLRRLSREYKQADSQTITDLMMSRYHEERQLGLFILVLHYQRAKSLAERDLIFNQYLGFLEKGRINNWDLVDCSAHHIVGAHLAEEDSRPLLYSLARSGELWRQRVAMISTFYFIKNHDYEDALRIAEILLNHEHDLIHKAVGWMLREIGNRDQAVEEMFLNQHYAQMPRTMLRYAIEKFSEPKRQDYLKGNI